MATVICVDGVGGNPTFPFRELKWALEEIGHKVVLVDVNEISTHKDRVIRVLVAYYKERLKGEDEICFLGFSAGGSAVYTSASDLYEAEEKVHKVILISPAVPLQAIPTFMTSMTPELRSGIANNFLDLVLGREISITEKEYVDLMAPFEPEFADELLDNRQKIPGKEARRLAFFPYVFRGYDYPTLMIYGCCDRWISP
jgi:hypothetical protein